MGYAQELLELMNGAHSKGDTERAIELAMRLMSQLPDSGEATEARRFLEAQNVGLDDGVLQTPDLLTSTTDEIDGYITIRSLGLVRGSTVRTRHVGSELAAGLKSIVGGELKGVTKLIADGREQAFARMCRDAESVGANAVKGLRFSTANVWEGAAEIMAYGTAVIVRPIEEGGSETSE